MDYHVVLSGTDRKAGIELQREFVVRDQDSTEDASRKAIRVAEAAGLYHPRVVNVRPYADQHTRI